MRVSLRRLIRLDSGIGAPPTIQQIINNNAADGKRLCVSAGRRQLAAGSSYLSHFSFYIVLKFFKNNSLKIKPT
jgi:hypothetical protein